MMYISLQRLIFGSHTAEIKKKEWGRKPPNKKEIEMNYQAHVELLLEVIEKSKHELDTAERELNDPKFMEHKAHTIYSRDKVNYYKGYIQGLDKAFYWLTSQWRWKYQEGWESDD